MLYFKKSQPAPACLAQERNKKSGDYKCGTVLTRLKDDFKNKCYLCEQKAPATINVEHFNPHKGDVSLKFDWGNLFWACGHCNNVKLAKHTNLLNCVDQTQAVETKLQYDFKPFPREKVRITALDSQQTTLNTCDLLHEIFNGTTKLKTIEAANIRTALLKEVINFQEHLLDYFDDTLTPKQRSKAERKIQRHLSRASNFTSFKRWIIRDNAELSAEFGRFLT